VKWLTSREKMMIYNKKPKFMRGPKRRKRDKKRRKEKYVSVNYITTEEQALSSKQLKHVELRNRRMEKFIKRQERHMQKKKKPCILPSSVIKFTLPPSPRSFSGSTEAPFQAQTQPCTPEISREEFLILDETVKDAPAPSNWFNFW